MMKQGEMAILRELQRTRRRWTQEVVELVTETRRAMSDGLSRSISLLIGGSFCKALQLGG